MKNEFVILGLLSLVLGCGPSPANLDDEQVPEENRQSGPPAGLQNNPGAPEPVRPLPPPTP